jgi:hypothetical protein
MNSIKSTPEHKAQGLTVAKRYRLAATAVVVTAAAATVVSNGSTAATTAAEEDEDKDNYPRAIVSTKVTHLRKPPFLFSSHTMQKKRSVLQEINK